MPRLRALSLHHEPMENRSALRVLAGTMPGNRVSGEKVLRRGTRHVVNRAANALRKGANALMPFRGRSARHRIVLALVDDPSSLGAS